MENASRKSRIYTSKSAIYEELLTRSAGVPAVEMPDFPSVSFKSKPLTLDPNNFAGVRGLSGLQHNLRNPKNISRRENVRFVEVNRFQEIDEQRFAGRQRAHFPQTFILGDGWN